MENENAPKFKNDKIKNSTIIMLENQYSHIEKNGGKQFLSEALSDPSTSQYSGSLTPDGNAYSDSGFFHKMAIPMVRRTFPELIAHEIVGVQPLTGPVGLAFAMRFVADGTYDGGQNQEIGHNTIDSSYTGSYETSAGEALGSNSSPDTGLGFGSGTQIPELSMTLEKDQVEAKTRKLRSRWSVEVAQDIENMHGLNLEEEMSEALAYEITSEIDRELMSEIRTVAPTTAYDYDSDFDGRWESERYRNLYNAVMRKANSIAVKTRRGPGNWVVANPTVCAALETLPSFAVHPAQADVNSAIYGVAKIGSLDGRMTLYRDTFYNTDSALVGYLGVNSYDTGIIYLPYVQLMQSRATDYGSFQPATGLMSRYAIHSAIFGASNFYEELTFSNMP
ncbi:hypothetical protein AKJ59_00735 [candidate division MSBL1 archaeon SCGC-AAA385M02]|uniref:Major capsid protein n=1 Tax=candidate division MSBL1 archaeon SCGC-AAA385M02 TaxID=1698287 RepID=A0A133VQ63_9EURY|nr:hypothetical protein AKJ59_00735 [candidate division MSBL1 archaeon SCGC-AAA385M02]